MDDWLKKWKAGGTNRKGQYMEEVYSAKNGLVEIIKYGSKIFTEPDLDKKSKTGTPTQIYLAALETIFTAMKGVRIFDRFGFNIGRRKSEVSGAQLFNAKLAAVYEEFEYDPVKSDWVNVANDEVLSGYKMPTQLEALLGNAIDIKMR